MRLKDLCDFVVTLHFWCDVLNLKIEEWHFDLNGILRALSLNPVRTQDGVL